MDSNNLKCLFFYQIGKLSCVYSSEIKPLTMSVPQVSILELLLFIIFINDLVLYDSNSNLTLYADDTILYNGHEDLIMACVNDQYTPAYINGVT